MTLDRSSPSPDPQATPKPEQESPAASTGPGTPPTPDAPSAPVIVPPAPEAPPTLIKPPGRIIPSPGPGIPAVAAPAAPAAAAPTTEAGTAPAAPAAEVVSKFALVVDDEPANRDFLVRLLEQAQLEVKGACDAADALNKLANVTSVRLIAIDHKLPDMDGVDLLAQLRTRFPQARLVMATMHDDRALMEKAFARGCDVFLVKPHGFMELFRRVQLLDSQEDGMQKLIIDQYGPRPYRG